MLTRLAIQNLVIVKDLELEFTSGMTVLTGETGAGKSILIDALGLSLGNKAEPSMIRSGKEKAEVSAEFLIDKIPRITEWLKKQELDDESFCILRRVLVKNGRSRSFINNKAVPQSILKELGGLLIQINGQNTHQLFIKNNFQRDLLDNFSGCINEVQKVTEAYTLLKNAQKQKLSLIESNLDKEKKIDYLEFQLQELEPIIENAKNYQKIENDHKKLSNSNSLRQDSAVIVDALERQEPNISSMLLNLTKRVQAMTNSDESLQETMDLIETVNIQLNEITQNVKKYSEKLETNPQKLSEIDAIIADLHAASRKHKVRVDELPSLFQELKNQHSALHKSSEKIQELDAQIEILGKKYDKASLSLSDKRQKAANELGKQMTKSIRALGMEKGSFEIICETDQEAFTSNGRDQIHFMISTNPGSSSGPLSKIASGGELSRVALALQVSISNCHLFPTIIFDEVDVGIGGAVAEIVGQLLRKLSDGYQILCVTHLPQVASQAHNHFRVKKINTKSSSHTQIESLSQNERVTEIARMLGGVDITDKTLEHAGEMMEQAQTLTRT